MNPSDCYVDPKFTGLHLGLHQSRQIAVYTKKKAAIFLDNCLIFK